MGPSVAAVARGARAAAAVVGPDAGASSLVAQEHDHIREDRLGQFMPLQKVAEGQDGGLVRDTVVTRFDPGNPTRSRRKRQVFRAFPGYHLASRDGAGNMPFK